MKNLKEALKACRRPEIEVPIFKSHLKSELERHRSKAHPWLVPAGFMALGSLVLLLAGLLTLFIVRPQVPREVNHWLSNKNQDISEHEGLALQQVNHSYPDPLQVVLSPEKDKVFAEQWVRQNHPQVAARVSSIESERIVTLRWVKLDNGRKILVMNELDPDQMVMNTNSINNQNGGVL